nr:cytochrome C [Chitinophagaceae bacterium]
MLKTIKQNWPVLAIVLAVTVALVRLFVTPEEQAPVAAAAVAPEAWTGPSLLTDRQLQGPERALVAYGADLVANTARYLGPQGSVAHLSNGLNCQNCHLDAGRRAWGNNYGAVASTYPKYRDRSGHIESIAHRVNDCFERSLNGQALDTTSREMRAIIAYIQWLGQAVPAGTKPPGSGIAELPYM